MPVATLPVRIEVSHPVTDDPTWIQEWNGTQVTTTRLPNADPDAGDIDDWGGYAFNDEWERVFARWDPQEVADEIIDLQNGAGFGARLLPHGIMAEHTPIEWADETWNPITGCSAASPGCRNCYAVRSAASRLKNHPSRQGLTRQTRTGRAWTGEVRFNEQWLIEPLRRRNRKRIFACAHADLFHPAVPTEWIDRNLDAAISRTEAFLAGSRN